LPVNPSKPRHLWHAATGCARDGKPKILEQLIDALRHLATHAIVVGTQNVPAVGCDHLRQQVLQEGAQSHSA